MRNMTKYLGGDQGKRVDNNEFCTAKVISQ